MVETENNQQKTQLDKSETDEIQNPLGKHPWWHALLLGVAAGSGGALIGVGGGIIMVPILTIWGMKQKKAQGTSLAVILAIAPVAVAVYYFLNKQNIDFHFAIPLAIGGVIGSQVGSRLALKFRNRILAKFFGFFLILIAIRMIFFKTPDAAEIEGVTNFIGYLETCGFGVLAGLAAGFFGVGGGVVFVPTGVLLGGLTQVVAQGASFTAMIPTALVSAFNYHRQKEIEWDLVKWMVPGAWFGAIFGSYGANVVPGPQLKVIFAIFLIFTALRRILNNSGIPGTGVKSGS